MTSVSFRTASVSNSSYNHKFEYKKVQAELGYGDLQLENFKSQFFEFLARNSSLKLKLVYKTPTSNLEDMFLGCFPVISYSLTYILNIYLKYSKYVRNFLKSLCSGSLDKSFLTYIGQSLSRYFKLA